MERSNRSSEFYQLNSSRDLYNGTSFRMGTWSPGTFYAHDDVNIDFVSYKGALLYCTRSHWSSASNEPLLITDREDIIGIEPNPFWDIVHTKGRTGDKGEKGDKGDKGERGEKGEPGNVNIEGQLNANAIAQSSSEPMANVLLSNNTLSFTFGLPKGDAGKDGKDGQDGKDGINGSDGVDGKDGINGQYLMYQYISHTSYNDIPYFESDNSNPGSEWSAIIPEKIKGEYIWSIQAYYQDNDFVGPWFNPVCLSGIDGEDGKDAIIPNWKTYIYKLSDSKPNKPESFNISPEGWSDYPDSSGQWWQCIGIVNGVTNNVIEWSDVLPVNGRDGIAQDGKHVEMRFTLGTTSTPIINKSDRTPDGWFTTPQTPTADSPHLWMVIATINPDDTLDGEWSHPVRISGEQGPKGDVGPVGPQGPTGSNGVSGIPGVSFAVQYCVGDEDSFEAYDNELLWSDNISDVKSKIGEDTPYIWCRQGLVSKETNDDTGVVNWSEPFKLSGTNGLNGTNGRDGKDGHGQVIYPMGIYNPNVVYITDEFKAPYVFDPDYNAFYLLNSSEWNGPANPDITPGLHVASGGTSWIKFDSFEVIYSKVGIIANGLVGSAVFNEDFMFSQMGIDPVTQSHISYCDGDGNMLFSEVDGNPYHSAAKFWPAYCVNLRTGQQWSANGDLCISDNSLTLSPTALPTDSIYGNSFFVETYQDEDGYKDVRSGIKSSSSKTNASITQVVGSLSPTITLESTRIAESGTSDLDVYKTSSFEVDQLHIGNKEIQNATGSGKDLYISQDSVKYIGSTIENNQNVSTTYRSIDFATGTFTGFDLQAPCLPIDSYAPKVLEVNQSDNELYSFYGNITSRTMILYSTDVGINVKLPSLEELKSNLAGQNYDETSFCLEINFVNVGDSELILYGYSNTNINGPHLYKAGSIESVSLDQKSTLTILFVYDENLSDSYQAYVK